MPEELRKKGFISLNYDKLGNEFFIIDYLNHHTWWFKSLTKAINEFDNMTKGIK